MTQISVMHVISKTAQDRDSVTMGHQLKMACVVSNCHTTHVVT